MRIYLGPALQQLISTVILIASLGLAGFVIWKAVDVWRADPGLEQLQNITNPQSDRQF